MTHTATQTDQRGIALLSALFLVLAVSLLGMTALHLAAQEVDSVSALQHDATGLHLAEAGLDLVIGWIHAPSTIPSEELRHLLTKRAGSSETGPSFFDEQGRSQFRGTPDHPDILFDARRSEDDALLNDPAQGWFRSLGSMGRVTSLKLYAPTRPDLLCTVEVSSVGAPYSQGAARTVRVQLAALPMPPVRSAVQIGVLPAVGTTASSVLAHWGNIQILGDGAVRTRGDIPSRSSLAPLTGLAYYEMSVWEDRWHEIKLGGSLVLLQPGDQEQPIPLNVFQRQMPVPGLRLDHWDYQLLKRIAQTHGTYYATDREGRLHPGGIQDGMRGLTLDEVMQSASVGDHRGLVFVDTLDAQPPRADNLAHLVAEASYAEGVFVVNADVTWHPRGTGASVPALTPPTADGRAMGSRVPVQLSGVHLNGVLSVPGMLKVEGAARVFGAVMAGGALSTTGTGLEVWYNHDLGYGLFRGLPVVSVAPGSWRAG